MIELGIRKQSHGYARQLLDALLIDRPEAFASPISRPGAQAHAIYQRRGWKKGDNTQTYPHWPVEDLNVLLLPKTIPPMTGQQSPRAWQAV